MPSGDRGTRPCEDCLPESPRTATGNGVRCDSHRQAHIRQKAHESYVTKRDQRELRKCARCQVDLERGYLKARCVECAKIPDPRCKKCKQVRPLSRFSVDNSRPSGFFPWCMDCQNDGTAEGKFQDPEAPLLGGDCPLCDTPLRGHRNRKFCSAGCKNRSHGLKKKYGLSVDQYRELVESTGGRCPICKRKPTTWHVDHDHKTRMVTGAVCSPCNVGLLACSGHDISLVISLFKYLKETPAERLGIVALAPLQESARPSRLHETWGRPPYQLKGTVGRNQHS